MAKKIAKDTKDYVRFPLRLEPGIHARLVSEAHWQRVSVNTLINHLLDQRVPERGTFRIMDGTSFS